MVGGVVGSPPPPSSPTASLVVAVVTLSEGRVASYMEQEGFAMQDVLLDTLLSVLLAVL